MELGKWLEKKDGKIMLHLLYSRSEFSPGGRKGSCLMTVLIFGRQQRMDGLEAG